MVGYTIEFLDKHLYPEIKTFPEVCIFESKPDIGETIEIGENHFKVTKIVHIPTVKNINYNQFVEPTVLFVEYS